MGTNYYHRTDVCPHCGRWDQRHIGKSLIMLQAHRADPSSGLDRPILSWQDWKQMLAAGSVFDEYGRRIATEDFIAQVEATSPAARRRQVEYLLEHALYRDRVAPTPPDPGTDLDEFEWSEWLDADGFSVSSKEFF